MKSIRTALTLRLVATTAVLSAVAATSLYLYVRAALFRQFDSGLEARARGLASIVHHQGDGGYELKFADESMPEYLPGRKSEYFEILLPGGKVLERSPSLKDLDLIDPGAADLRNRAWNQRLPDGRWGRAVMVAQVVSDDQSEETSEGPEPATAVGGPGTVFVVTARDRSEVDGVLTALMWGLALGTVMLMGACMLAVRFIVAHGLRSVNQLGAEAASIGPDTLDYRFARESVPAELQPICGRLNDLLERLEAAFSRERRISADIAHELRTPVAELRALAEVAAGWTTIDGKAAEYFRDVRDVALGMESLVETLLALARSHFETAQAKPESLELGPLVAGIVAIYRRTAASRGLVIAEFIPAGVVVRTDRVMLSRIVENLVSNAVHYATKGSSIDCRTTAHDGVCELVISNDNDALTPEDLDQMFEPFWRKDASRSRCSNLGLGLALVAEYARHLGIAIKPRLINGGKRMAMVVVFPTKY